MMATGALPIKTEPSMDAGAMERVWALACALVQLQRTNEALKCLEVRLEIICVQGLTSGDCSSHDLSLVVLS